MITPVLTQSNTQRSEIHTSGILLPGCVVRLEGHQFFFGILGGKKVIAFQSLPPAPSLSLYCVRSLHTVNMAGTVIPMGRRAASGCRFLHFVPGVTHQPSQRSAVKCQQSQIPAPRLMSASTPVNEFFRLVSILCMRPLCWRLDFKNRDGGRRDLPIAGERIQTFKTFGSSDALKSPVDLNISFFLGLEEELKSKSVPVAICFHIHIHLRNSDA